MDWIRAALADRQRTMTLRTLQPVARRGQGRVGLAAADGSLRLLADFASNDYLAFSEHPEIIAAGRQCLERLGAGAGAARLMSGDLELHHQLEAAIARLKGKEAALLFGSGYLANVGIIPALVGRQDVIFSDRLNHASIYDGCRLSGARLVRFRHNDLNDLEERLKKERGRFRRALLVVESIYSMDGDRCPLREMVALKKRFDCLLLVDEAHATGVFGPGGAGVIEEDGVTAEVDLSMGTLGKALGCYGAFVAASEEMVLYLINHARSFIFSTALPPGVVGAALKAIELVGQGPQLRLDVLSRAAHFRTLLQRGGVGQVLGCSQIIPLVVGSTEQAWQVAQALRDQGIFAPAVRPPTVPAGAARIRFSITHHLSEEVLVQAAETIQVVMRTMGLV